MDKALLEISLHLFRDLLGENETSLLEVGEWVWFQTHLLPVILISMLPRVRKSERRCRDILFPNEAIRSEALRVRGLPVSPIPLVYSSPAPAPLGYPPPARSPFLDIVTGRNIKIESLHYEDDHTEILSASRVWTSPASSAACVARNASVKILLTRYVPYAPLIAWAALWEWFPHEQSSIRLPSK